MAIGYATNAAELGSTRSGGNRAVKPSVMESPPPESPASTVDSPSTAEPALVPQDSQPTEVKGPQPAEVQQPNLEGVSLSDSDPLPYNTGGNM